MFHRANVNIIVSSLHSKLPAIKFEHQDKFACENNEEHNKLES